eukprot:scaffold429902_cov20-Prasinocladus_malaysianus.AAC.1
MCIAYLLTSSASVQQFIAVDENKVAIHAQYSRCLSAASRRGDCSAEFRSSTGRHHHAFIISC